MSEIKFKGTSNRWLDLPVMLATGPDVADGCRRRGDAINHSLHVIARLWNLKTNSTQAIQQQTITGHLLGHDARP
jgi:hypothetical protein